MQPDTEQSSSVKEEILIVVSLVILFLVTTKPGKATMKMIKNILINWKTTSAGVSLVIIGVTHLGFALKKGITEADMAATLISICGGCGLIAAGDAGAQPPPPPLPPTIVADASAAKVAPVASEKSNEQK